MHIRDVYVRRKEYDCYYGVSLTYCTVGRPRRTCDSRSKRFDSCGEDDGWGGGPERESARAGASVWPSRSGSSSGCFPPAGRDTRTRRLPFPVAYTARRLPVVSSVTRHTPADSCTARLRRLATRYTNTERPATIHGARARIPVHVGGTFFPARALSPPTDDRHDDAANTR